ncbi:MAG TPA: hypothetical protein VNE58_13885 [Casimicrobiaceae bacterium]|nr:hypothetical protein [Casimicrobiaceae bacterium]
MRAGEPGRRPHGGDACHHRRRVAHPFSDPNNCSPAAVIAKSVRMESCPLNQPRLRCRLESPGTWTTEAFFSTRTYARKDDMADEQIVKSPQEKLQDTLSQLKEMEHYSQANIEKLAALWLEVSEQKGKKPYEKMIDEVLSRQNQFQESIVALIEAYEEDIAKLKG